jgi:Tripartite ATP-independent periplasmic transporters, DctQ component
MTQGYELEQDHRPLEIQVHGTLEGPARLLALVNRAVILLSMIAIVVACCVLTLSVVMRYFLKMPTDWQDEASIFLLVGATFLTGAYVQAHRGHVGIEALAEILPAGINRLRLLFVDVASFAFCRLLLLEVMDTAPRGGRRRANDFVDVGAAAVDPIRTDVRRNDPPLVTVVAADIRTRFR